MQTKENFFLKRPVLAYSLLILVVLILFEVISFITFFSLDVYRILSGTAFTAPNFLHAQTVTQYVDDPTLLFKELMETTEDKIRFHPFHWYAGPKNYRGKYIRTDAYGFRNEHLNPEKVKIAFIGGSTTHSVYTRQEGSFPYLFNLKLNPKNAEAANLGLPGINTSAEISVLIEAKRMYPNLKYVFFYDGVNESSIYIEGLGFEPNAHQDIYKLMGYYSTGAIKNSTRNSELNTYSPPLLTLFGRYFPYSLYTIEKIKRSISALTPKNDLAHATDPNLNIDHHQLKKNAQEIAEIYYQNITVLDGIAKRLGITAVFIYQPNIFSTHAKKFTPEEIAILNNPANRPIKLLNNELYNEIMKRIKADRSTIIFEDWSSAFNQLDAKHHFIDYCHVSENANQLLAHRFEALARKIMPAEYWNEKEGDRVS